jgi:hypothetical protein
MPSRKMAGQCLKLGRRRFLSHPYPFVFYWLPFHATQSQLLTALLNKQLMKASSGRFLRGFR